MAGSVFISYSRTDRPYVDRLATHLRNADLPVWYDYELEAGDRFAEVIQAALNGCAALVVVRTPAAMASEWVGREITLAQKTGKPVLPLLLLPCEDHILLVDLQEEDVTGGRLPAPRFVARLRQLTGSSPFTAAAEAPVLGRPATSAMPAEAATRPAPAREPTPSAPRLDLGSKQAVSTSAAPGSRGAQGSRSFRELPRADRHHGTARQWSSGGSVASPSWWFRRLRDRRPAVIVVGIAAIMGVVATIAGVMLATGGGATSPPTSPQPISTEPLIGAEGTITSLAFSPDGQTVAAGSGDRSVRLWQIDTGRAVGEPLVGPTESVTSVAFSPNGKQLAAGSYDGKIRIWNAMTGNAVGTPMSAGNGRVQCVAFSPDGELLVSGGDDGMVYVWDPETTRQADEPFRGNDDIVRALAFSPDGQVLATAGYDSKVRLWSLRDGAMLGSPLTGHSTIIVGIAFSSDNDTVATAGFNDHTVRLWSRRSGQAKGEPFTIPDASIWSVAFSPDGHLLASGSSDHVVRVWNLNTRQLEGSPFEATNGAVTSLAFSRDGILATGDDEGHVRLWRIDGASPIAGQST